MAASPQGLPRPRVRLLRSPRPEPPSDWLSAAWNGTRDAWLAGRGKHTRRAYAKALQLFTEFVQEDLGLRLWQVRPSHVCAWQKHLESSGLAAATISQRMASVSSFYAFVVEQRIDGRLLYGDRRGRPLANPFASEAVTRPPTPKYAQARALSSENAGQMLRAINRDSLTGARDYALLLTYLLTGWRPGEVLALRWGDIRQAKKGQWQARCQGQWQPISAHLVEALHAYARHSERDMQPDAYLWQPLSTRGCRNFIHVGRLPANRAITPTQATNILRKRLRMAGIPQPERFCLHSLRHTYAHTFIQQVGDLAALSHRLRHADVATTRASLAALDGDPSLRALEHAYGL